MARGPEQALEHTRPIPAWCNSQPSTAQLWCSAVSVSWSCWPLQQECPPDGQGFVRSESPLNSSNHRVHTQAPQGPSMTRSVWTSGISPGRQHVYWSPAILEWQWSPIFLQENGTMINFGKTTEKAVYEALGRKTICTKPTVHDTSDSTAAVSSQPQHTGPIHAGHLRSHSHTVLYCSTGLLFLPLPQEERRML